MKEEFFPAYIFILGFSGLMSDLPHPELRRKGAISVGFTALYLVQVYTRYKNQYKKNHVS